METSVKKSIVMLALSAAWQLPIAHAETDPPKSPVLLAADQGRLNNSPEEVEGVKGSNLLTADQRRLNQSAAEVSEMISDASHGTGLHPSLTDDPGQFEGHIKTGTLSHVDFSNVVEEMAPFVVEGAEGAVSIFGGSGNLHPQAVTSVMGMPASYWFGDQAEPTFVLTNGNVQIVFEQDAVEVSMTVEEVIEHVKTEQMASPVDEDYKFRVALLDTNGNMIGSESLDLTSHPSFLGIASDIPFRSVIVTSTSGNWLFSNLNYAMGEDRATGGTEVPTAKKTSKPAEKYDAAAACEGGFVQQGQCVTDPAEEKLDLPCSSMNDGTCTTDGIKMLLLPTCNTNAEVCTTNGIKEKKNE